MKSRALIARTVTLLIALFGLTYLYMYISEPPGGEVAEVKDLRLLWTFYGTGQTADQLLNRPHNVAVGGDGNIYITDSGHQRVLVLDTGRRLIAKLYPGANSKPDLKSASPSFKRGYLGIAVAKNGNIYVADKLRNKIYILDKSGRNLGEINVMSPIALTVANDKLYATTYGHVVVYDLRGRKFKEFGRRGSRPGQFDFPGGIAVDKKGNIYVADSNNNRLVAMDPDGNVLWTVGKKSASMNDPYRTFGLPEGLTIDDNGILYMVDAFTGTIDAFNPNGKKLAEIGEWGQKEGQFYYPAGIAFAGGRTFIVADKFNDRLEAVELNVPGVPGASLKERPFDALLKNPALALAIIAIALVCGAAIVWQRLKAKE